VVIDYCKTFGDHLIEAHSVNDMETDDGTTCQKHTVHSYLILTCLGACT